MMKALDEKIREEYPDVYKKVENKVAWAIRRSGYLLYYPGHFCIQQMIFPEDEKENHKLY